MKKDLEQENLEEALEEEVLQDEILEENSEEDNSPEETPAEELKEEESNDQKFLRLMADFQNYKKRVEKEKTDIYAYANEKIIGDMLNVIDNFERALAQGSEDKAFASGMELILKQLTDALTNAGLEEIKSLGEDFDPNLHNAVLTGDDDQFESGKVTEVFQKGYTLKGKLLRAAMVKVNN